MKRFHRLFFCIAAVLWFPVWMSDAFAGDRKEYAVKNIPAALLVDADAVVRTAVTHFEIKKVLRSFLKIKRAVTIFKSDKRDYGCLYIPYDKFTNINNLDGALFDVDGEKIRGLESTDIKDISSFDGSALISDERMKIVELYNDRYPYTVEFTYEIEYEQNLNWPDWSSQETLDAVEQSRFEVALPAGDTLQHWCSSDTVKPVLSYYGSLDGDKKKFVWEARNLPKLLKDVVGDDNEDFSTVVHIAPTLFEIDHYAGDMRTWRDFGKWDYSLLKDRDILPESVQKEIRSLIQPSDSIRTKISKLYRYMQDHTRYISIQLGIGGWQPFDAAYVHEHGYGDCKALSNYMVALLKTAGITAYSVLIRPGDYRYTFNESFPSNQFTHVIVCVPFQKDTVWLECTDSSIPAGHLGFFTEHRGALLISPEGGFVVHTPRSTPEQNSQISQATVVLTSAGNAGVSCTTQRTGDQADYIRFAMDKVSPRDRERWILKTLDIPTANLNKYSIDGLETRSPEILLNLELDLPRFASFSGDRIFFKTNLLNRYTSIPHKIERRLSPLRYEYPYLDRDSIVYKLPQGYVIETLPPEVRLTTSFSSFIARTVLLGDSIVVYTRSLQIHEYVIPADHYAEYRKFWSDVVSADRAQVVLVRKPW